MRDYSRDIVKAIKNYLEDQEWDYCFDEQNASFKFELLIKGQIKKLSYKIMVFEEGYVVYTLSSLGVPPKGSIKMRRMENFICRVNYKMLRGNLELDQEEGNIWYKFFVDCEGGIIPTYEIVRNSIIHPIKVFQKYGFGIAEMIFGNASIEETASNCEGDSLNKNHQIYAEKKVPSQNKKCEDRPMTMMERLALRLGPMEEMAERDISDMGISDSTDQEDQD
jgi:Family of unknown function (DUF1790).